MLGFSAFANGFALQSINTTCTFNDFWLVGGPVSLNRGTLILQEDLIFNSGATINSVGTINAHNHAIILENEKTATIPINNWINLLNSQDPGEIPLNAAWSADNKYIAVGTMQSGSNQELRIYAFDGFSLTFTAGVHLGLSVYALAWQPAEEAPPYYLIAGTSNGLYAYQFTPPSALVATSTVGTGTSFTAVAWHPSGNTVAVGRRSATTQQIMMFNCNAGTLSYNTSYSFLPTQAVGDRNVLEFDYTGSYLAVGLTIANQLQVLQWDGASLLTTTAVNTGSAVNTVSWSPDGS